VGHIASFDLEGHREVTYWIGREDWGRGIATRALKADGGHLVPWNVRSLTCSATERTTAGV
jgi:hypothetical protein